jgi:hypothetical protein
MDDAQPDESEREYTRDDMTLFERIVASPEEADASLQAIQQQGRKVFRIFCASAKELFDLKPQFNRIPDGHDLFLQFTPPGVYLSWDLIEGLLPNVLDNTLTEFCLKGRRVYVIRYGKTRRYELPENSQVWPPPLD